MVSIESAMGEKVSILLMTIVTSIFGFFYAYIKCWRMSLILTGFLPIMMVAGIFMMKAMQFKAQISKVSYEGASGVA
jgi:ABC-type multidrug transport system fused ATPase/permease subunit